MITAIETVYRGCRYRSRLEARWAVIWHHLGIKQEYEPEGYEGFTVPGRRRYLPDFRLSNGTWVEVKGSEAALDHDLMRAAAEHLPGDAEPRLLILGPVPEPPQGGNWAWIGLSTAVDPAGELVVFDGWWQFTEAGISEAYTGGPTPACCNDPGWLDPATAVDEPPVRPFAAAAYRAGRSARFEHGETGR